MENNKEIIGSGEGFSVTFGGKSSIDAELYSKSIGVIDLLIKESGKAVGIKSKDKSVGSSLRLEVNAVKKGSVGTFFDLIVSNPSTQGVFIGGVIVYGVVHITYMVFKIVLAYFEIKEHLKGSREKNRQDLDDKSIIENKYGEKKSFPIYIVNIYYKNPKIDKLMCKIFIENDRKYVSFKLGKDSIKIPHSAFKEMATNILYDEIVDTRTVPSELYIRKAYFDGESKWGFKINNKLINAKVADPYFLAKIRNGSMKLNAGLKIRCMLRIDDKIGSTGEIIHEYTVEEVIGKPFQGKVINKPSQDGLI